MQYIKVTLENGETLYLSVYLIRYLRNAENGGTVICTELRKKSDYGFYVQEDIETVYARIQDAKKR